jgi:hypothetical protein
MCLKIVSPSLPALNNSANDVSFKEITHKGSIQSNHTEKVRTGYLTATDQPC